MRHHVGVIALLLISVPVLGACEDRDPPSSRSSRITNPSPDSGYWTEERLRDAMPEPMPTEP